MSPQAREAFLEEANAYLSDPRLTMTEGRPHKLAKQHFADVVGLHFRALGKPIYIAEDLAVHHPGEPVFSPDVLAVLGVEQPADAPRLAWVVLDERRGLDLVLEVVHQGDRRKDLSTNVARYARLGIPEYFVYDRAQQRLYGFRLEGADATEYAPMIPQHGRFRSAVLELDLMIVDGSLRVFAGVTELIATDALVGRLQRMLDRAAEDADSASRAAMLIAARGAQLAELRIALMAVLDARGLAPDDDAHARIEAATDVEQLRGWLTRAATATRLDDVLER